MRTPRGRAGATRHQASPAKTRNAPAGTRGRSPHGRRPFPCQNTASATARGARRAPHGAEGVQDADPTASQQRDRSRRAPAACRAGGTRRRPRARRAAGAARDRLEGRGRAIQEGVAQVGGPGQGEQGQGRPVGRTGRADAHRRVPQRRAQRPEGPPRRIRGRARARAHAGARVPGHRRAGRAHPRRRRGVDDGLGKGRRRLRRVAPARIPARQGGAPAEARK